MSKSAFNQRTMYFQSLEMDTEPIGLWVERFLNDRRSSGTTPGTIQFYTAKMQLFIRFCGFQAVERLEQVTPDVIRAFLQWLEANGHNPGGRHAAYRTLRAFLKWVWDELDITSPNPISKVKAPRVPVEPLEPVTTETVKALMDTCKQDNITGARDRALILFLLDTGTRAAECLAVDVADVETGSGAVLIRQGKGRKPRTVYMGKTTRKALRAYLKLRGMEPGALWVTVTGTRLTYNGLRELLRRRARAAGVDEPSPHDFRRGFALAMLRAGVDVLSISRLMGHTSLAVLQRYIKQTDMDGMIAHAKGSPVENM